MRMMLWCQIFSLVSAFSAQHVPCVQVSDAGMSCVNGLYAEEALPGYAGPMAFHKASPECDSDLWVSLRHSSVCHSNVSQLRSPHPLLAQIFRWHQTFWHLANLDVAHLNSEESFTAPVIYTSLVQALAKDAPPPAGWTGDVMRQYGPPPFPHLSEVGVCSVSDDGTLTLVPSSSPALVPTQRAEATGPSSSMLMDMNSIALEVINGMKPLVKKNAPVATAPSPAKGNSMLMDMNSIALEVINGVRPQVKKAALKTARDPYKGHLLLTASGLLLLLTILIMATWRNMRPAPPAQKRRMRFCRAEVDAKLVNSPLAFLPMRTASNAPLVFMPIKVASPPASDDAV